MSHVGLIFGGPSAEHDVSLCSAKSVLSGLIETSHEVTLLGVTKSQVWKKISHEQLLQTNFTHPLNLETIGEEINFEETLSLLDVAFPVVHGPWGEDGQLQKILEDLQVEFVGSHTQACINCLDKEKTKQLASEQGINQVPYLSFSSNEPSFKEVQEELGLPLFVKPANMGSSVGIHKVKEESTWAAAIEDATKYDNKIIVEKGVQAREIECALIEENGEIKVTGLGEIKPHHEFYSYEAKYLDPNGADLIIPAIVNSDIADDLRKIAKKAFQALGCRDYARADFFLTDDGVILFNEINTYPGFTSISQFPMLWKQEGLAINKLVDKLVNNALKRKMDK